MQECEPIYELIRNDRNELYEKKIIIVTSMIVDTTATKNLFFNTFADHSSFLK